MVFPYNPVVNITLLSLVLLDLATAQQALVGHRGGGGGGSDSVLWCGGDQQEGDDTFLHSIRV